MFQFNVRPRLIEILKEKNMTQMQLSELTGIGQGSISRFDRNKQHIDLHLVLISKALNVSIEELFYIEDVSENK